MKPNYLALGLAGLVSLSSGCSSTRGSWRTPVIDHSQCSIQEEKENYRLGIEPFDTSAENKEVFGANVNSKGYLPIYMVFTNNHQNKEMAIYASGNCSFQDNTGAQWVEVGGRELAKSFGKNPTANAIFYSVMYGAVVGIVIKEATKDYNRQMQKDLDKTMMESQNRVLPGATDRGFIIFRHPEDHRIDSDDFNNLVRNGKFKIRIYKGKDEGFEDCFFIFE